MRRRGLRFICSLLTALAANLLCASLTRAIGPVTGKRPSPIAPASLPASIVVENKIIASSPVSPLLYSGYIELTNGHEDAILAQMLYDRDFEIDKSDLDNNVVMEASKKHKIDAPHVSEYGWENWSNNIWWNSSYEENCWYLIRAQNDNASTYEKFSGHWWPSGHGDHFARVVNKSRTDSVCLAQDGIRVRKGISYTFSGLFCDGTHFSAAVESKNPVTVEIALYPERKTDQPPLASAKLTIDSAAFQNFSVELPACDRDAHATFVIRVPAGRHLDADLLSMVPSDNVDGFRRDVVEMTKSLHLGTIRWPGGCTASFYKWRDGVGPLEKRPVTKGGFDNKDLVNDLGTVEFVKFCRDVGAQPLFCIPVMFGRPEDAADWVAFCNAPKHILRTNSGISGPLGVKYWEMDNENYRFYDAIAYAHKVVEFSRAMKAVDPSIKIIMADYFVYHPVLQQMLEIAGPDIDMVVNRGGPLAEIRSDVAALNDYNRQHNRKIALCDTEHNAHDWDPVETAALHPDGVHRANSSGDRTLDRSDKHSFWTYALGTMADYMDFQNLGGTFQFCNYYGAFNHWGLGLIDCGLDRTYLSAPGQAIEFMQSQAIAWPLAMDDVNDPTIKCSAAWNTDKTILTIQVLNYNATAKDISVDLSRLGVSFSREISVDRLSAQGPRVFTQENAPSPIKRETKSVTVEGVPFHYVFPPYSATAIRVKLKR